MEKFSRLALAALVLTQQPAEAKKATKKHKKALSEAETIAKPDGIVVDQCKSWKEYINPNQPNFPDHDKVQGSEFARHFVFKGCKHPRFYDETDRVVQMSEKEYKRALLPEDKWKVFKNKDGEWQYWCLERLTEEQRQLYYQLMAKIELTDLRYRVWENDMIKYLVFDNWNVENAYKRVLGKNDYLEKYGFPIDPQEVKAIQDSGMFRVQGFDEYGRGAAWIQTRKMLPGKHGVEAYMKFIIYTQELAQMYNASKDFRTDDYVTQDAWVIVDHKNVGLQNMSIEFQIKVALLMWSSYVLMTHRIIMVNVNWVLTSSYALVKPFLPQEVIDVMSMHGEKDLSWQDDLFTHIPREQVPLEYGGLAEWAPVDFSQM